MGVALMTQWKNRKFPLEFSTARLVEKTSGKNSPPCKGGFFHVLSSPTFSDVQR